MSELLCKYWLICVREETGALSSPALCPPCPWAMGGWLCLPLPDAQLKEVQTQL